MAFPEVHVIAGPNGAGKTSFASRYLPPGMEFVNADEVARQLPADVVDHRDVQAGRAVLQRMSELEDQRASFAIETTLSGTSIGVRLRRLHEAGYRIILHYVWLRQVELAIARVAARVKLGKHHIHEADIRRRYDRGLRNFVNIHLPLSDVCYVYDNSEPPPPQLIAFAPLVGEFRVVNSHIWTLLRRRSKYVRRTRQPQ